MVNENNNTEGWKFVDIFEKWAPENISMNHVEKLKKKKIVKNVQNNVKKEKCEKSCHKNEEKLWKFKCFSDEKKK